MPVQGVIAGDNWPAIGAATAAFYAIGFLMYGLLFSKLWLRLTGYSTEELKPHMWKMALSPIMPGLASIGLALLFKLCRVDSLADGVVIAFMIWFFLILSTRLYAFVYGPQKIGLLALDALHLLLGYVTAGAIIGGWR